jgi:hypothetical protein
MIRYWAYQFPTQIDKVWHYQVHGRAHRRGPCHKRFECWKNRQSAAPPWLSKYHNPFSRK